jgi:acetylornithine deacetylase/succinyl-diaminopimelate desuccinylase-like protein
MGHTPEIGYWHFCTNGSHYGGEAGIKTIGFGPGDLHTAHIIDEYMPMDQLMKATWLYTGIIRALSSLSSEKIV